MTKKRLFPFFLLSTLLPLVLVGTGLLVSSYRELKEESAHRRDQLLHTIESQTAFQIQLWKNSVRLLSTSKDLSPDLLQAFPEIRSVRFFSSPSVAVESLKKTGVLQMSPVPDNPNQLLTYLKGHGFWQGPAQTTPEGYPYFSMAALRPGAFGEQKGWVLADISLEPLSRMLQTFSIPCSLWEGDLRIADSQPMRMVMPRASESTESQSVLSLPLLGWTLKFSDSWSQTYRPVILLFLRLLVGLAVVGVLSAFIGMRISKKAQVSLQEQSRLATIGQMASMVGHEIRTALAVVKNSVSYLKDHFSSDDAKCARHLEIIESQIKSSNQILADILSFSRKREVELKPVPLKILLEDVLSSFPFPDAMVVEKNIGDNLPSVVTEEVEFKQAVSNVVLNAVQAMGTSGHLNIATASKEKSVSVIITDSGPGIPKTVLKKVTEPFFTTKTQGTGLGLAVVQKIMDRHKGQLHIQSKPGQGTRVELVFHSKPLAGPGL